MELRRYIQILWRRAPWIVLTMLVAVGLVAARTDRTSLYSSTTKLYVGASQFNFGQTQGPLSGDVSAGLNRVMLTFAAMIDSEPIAVDAIELAGVPRSAAGVVSATEAAPVLGTNLLAITITDPDPAVAQSLASSVAEAFVQRIGTLEPGQGDEGDVPTAPVSIFERAKLPTVPEQPALVPNLIVAGLFGGLLAAGLILLAEYLDITVKTAEDAERRLELPVLAVIPVLALDPSTTLRQAARRRSRRREEIGLVRDG